MGVAMGPLTILQACFDAHGTDLMRTCNMCVEAVHDGKVAQCKQTLEFHKRSPFVERVTFVLSPDTVTTTVNIVLRDPSTGSKVASGTILVTCTECCDASYHNVVRLYRRVETGNNIKGVGMEGSTEITLEPLVGSMEVQVTLLSSRHMSSRNRWKVVHQYTIVHRLNNRIRLRFCLVAWHHNANQNRVHISQTPLMTKHDYAPNRLFEKQLKIDLGSDQFPVNDDQSTVSFQSCAEDISDDEVELVMRLSEAAIAKSATLPGSQLHPLEQHTGGRVSNQHWSDSCNCCHTVSEIIGNKGLRWTAAHPLALQGFEDLHLVHADAWKVPGPAGSWPDLVDDLDARVPPPVAKVTAIYGVNVRTLRTIFLRHRDAHVTGGSVDDLEAVLQLDSEADIDGLLCYDGHGFETDGVPQIQPDTHNQVYLSGDGTVNYQSLRYCATWKDRCDVKVFELPGCDHRGVSYDPRMLQLLRGVLGLEEPEEEQTIEGEMHKLSELASDRFGSVTRWIAGTWCCSIIAKTGFRSGTFDIDDTYERCVQKIESISKTIQPCGADHGHSQSFALYICDSVWSHSR